MKKMIRKIAMLVLFAVFVISTVLLLRQWSDNARGASSYQDAIAIAAEKAEYVSEHMQVGTVNKMEEQAPVWVPAPVGNDPMVEELAQINLAALRAVNPDVVGWVRIPDTKIDFPLMQGQDNDFYLNHTWNKEPNSVGSVFLEHQNSADLTDYNTIIYGHNMNDGAMFADLELFSLQKFWKEHPFVYILSDAGVYRYEIFAFFQAEIESLTYGMNPQRDDTKEKFLNLALDKAWFDTGIRPPITDRILTLSTCSGANYDYRYVVQARLPMVEVKK